MPLVPISTGACAAIFVVSVVYVVMFLSCEFKLLRQFVCLSSGGYGYPIIYSVTRTSVVHMNLMPRVGCIM